MFLTVQRSSLQVSRRMAKDSSGSEGGLRDL